jgi:hypothetical protein
MRARSAKRDVETHVEFLRSISQRGAKGVEWNGRLVFGLDAMRCGGGVQMREKQSLGS